MADCECQRGCLLFNNGMATEPAAYEMYKNAYCRGEKRMCARYMVFSVLGEEAVPADLLPDQVERAHDFIGSMVVTSV